MPELAEDARDVVEEIEDRLFGPPGVSSGLENGPDVCGADFVDPNVANDRERVALEP